MVKEDAYVVIGPVVFHRTARVPHNAIERHLFHQAGSNVDDLLPRDLELGAWCQVVDAFSVVPEKQFVNF